MPTIKWHWKPESFYYRPPTAFPQYQVADGTSVPITCLRYDGATEEIAYLMFRAINYGSGNFNVTVGWYAATGGVTSGGIAMGFSIAAYTPNTDTGSVEAKSFATELIATDTHLGTTDKRLHDFVATLTALDSLAADDYVVLRVARKPADAADTMSGSDLGLTDLILTYSDT